MASNQITWNGGLQQEAVELLSTPGHIVVTPTKVGYIIATSPEWCSAVPSNSSRNSPS